MTAGAVRLEAGSVLDERYQLEKVIGRGGMGTVFAAKHLELGETVAVKVLQTGTAFNTLEAEHLERFLREARLAAKIKNEHVVRVLDVSRGKNGAPPFIVMEMLDGMDLGDVIEKHGRVPIPEAVDYILQACEALAEAHALGVVHRDLKSSNLHRTRHPDGTFTIKVLDFGISKTAEDTLDEGKLQLTSTSAVFGSPAYMSPEQIRSAKHVDARSDVWSLAVVLYELVANKLPFKAETASAMLAAISVDAPTPLAEHGVLAPPGFEQAIGAALAKDREQRTANVGAFAASIAPFGGAGAAASLAAVNRAMTRVASRNNGSLQPPPLAGPNPQGVSTGPVSDTVRASNPWGAGSDPGRPALQRPSDPGAAIARSGGLTGTDRQMVVSTHAPKPGMSTGVIVGMLGLAFGVAIAVSAVGIVIVRGSRPAEPPPVVVTAPPALPSTAIAAPAPIPEPPPVVVPVEAAPSAFHSGKPKQGSPAPVPHPAAHPSVTPVNSAKSNDPSFDYRH